MIKKELAIILSQRMNISLFNAELMIDRVLRNIIYALRKNEKVTISNFGTFQGILREAKSVRNPRTKQMMLVPAYKKIVFKHSDALYNKINTLI